jgi:hypothetical protein
MKAGQPEKLPHATDTPVHGLIRLAPDRVYDPETGRYYKVTPPSEKPN